MNTRYRLPETLFNWPWPRVINPHYEVVSAESDEWLRSFRPFSPKAQTAFEACKFGLLASLAYPTLSKEHLRTGCDLMNLFFVFDHYTDPEEAGAVRVMASIVMDAIRNPHQPRPEGETVLGEIARQFWARAVLTASATFQGRFVEVFQRYTDSVVEQAEDRENKYMRTLDQYIEVRRLTIGAEPSFAIQELGMDLPQEAFYHPAVQALMVDVTDLIILGNDMCSYNIEQAAGDEFHNVLCIVMFHEHLDLNGALAWLEAYHEEKVAHLLDIWKEVQTLSWGPKVDADMTGYLQDVLGWVRTNDAWNFESGRYFGEDGLAIQKHRMVTLMHKLQ